MIHSRTFDTSPAIKVYSTLPQRTSGEDAISRVRITIGQFLFTATDDFHISNINGEVDRYADAVKRGLDGCIGRDSFAAGIDILDAKTFRYRLHVLGAGHLYGYECHSEAAVNLAVENLNDELDRLFANILKDADAKQVASEHVPQTFEIGEVVGCPVFGGGFHGIQYGVVKSIDKGKAKEYHVLKEPDEGVTHGQWELTKVTDQETIDEVNARFAAEEVSTEEATEILVQHTLPSASPYPRYRVRIVIGDALFMGLTEYNGKDIGAEVVRYKNIIKSVRSGALPRDKVHVSLVQFTTDVGTNYHMRLFCGHLGALDSRTLGHDKVTAEKSLAALVKALDAALRVRAPATESTEENKHSFFEQDEVVEYATGLYGVISMVHEDRIHKRYQVKPSPNSLAGDFGAWELRKVENQAIINATKDLWKPVPLEEGAASAVEDRPDCEPKPCIKIGDVVRYGTNGFHGIVTGIPSKPNHFVVKANPSASGGILDASKLRFEIDPEVIAQVKARFAPKAFVLSPEVPPRVRFIFEGSAFETSRIPSRDEAIDLCNRLNAFLKIIDHRAPTEDEEQTHFDEGKEHARVEFEGQIGKITAQRDFLAKALNDAAVDMEEGKKPLQVFAAIVRALHSYETTLED